MGIQNAARQRTWKMEYGQSGQKESVGGFHLQCRTEEDNKVRETL